MNKVSPAPTKNSARKVENSKTTSKKFLSKEMYNELLSYLQKKYPKCFTTPPSPLAIGIHKALREKEHEKMSNNTINKLLYRYTANAKYKKALENKGNRLDLEGNTVSLVDFANNSKKSD